MRKMTVYLCGPINGCGDSECNDWRTEAKNHFLSTLDPMRRDYRGREDDCVSEIVTLDKVDVSCSDVILAMCPRPSVGTSMEIFFAWTLGKPVYVVAPTGAPVSPWLRYHSTRVCKSLNEAIEAIKSI